MGDYIAQRIIDEAYTYQFVVSKRSDLKATIDNYLIEKNREDLIV